MRNDDVWFRRVLCLTTLTYDTVLGVTVGTVLPSSSFEFSGSELALVLSLLSPMPSWFIEVLSYLLLNFRICFVVNWQ